MRSLPWRREGEGGEAFGSADALFRMGDQGGGLTDVAGAVWKCT